MDVLKVFTDEPLPLDAAADEPVPRGQAREMASLEDILKRPAYARAYLAGARLGDSPAVGLTSLSDDSLYLRPIRALTTGFVWSVPMIDAAISWHEISDRLRQPPVENVVAAGPEMVDPGLLTHIADTPGRAGWRYLRDALDRQPDALIFVAEHAHDGYDWIAYAGRPLRERLIDALRAHPAPEARRLVMPFQKARGEHKFYLERWALDDLPEWALEV
ncbi:MAG TPA: hypothetical protein EYQ24_04430 [Bacteroidetes bacterium]|nr:hypothetical protein [Bacteroidota bacterium]HIL58272.1 hypothetical protein [Rhodothermales bacterium]